MAAQLWSVLSYQNQTGDNWDEENPCANEEFYLEEQRLTRCQINEGNPKANDSIYT